jgi:hypothetical protein
MNYVLSNDDLRRHINDFACGDRTIRLEYLNIFNQEIHDMSQYLNPFLKQFQTFSQSQNLCIVFFNDTLTTWPAKDFFQIESIKWQLYDRLNKVTKAQIVETSAERMLRLNLLGFTVSELKERYPPQFGTSPFRVAVRANDLSSVEIFLRNNEFDVGDMSRALHDAAHITNNPAMIHALLKPPGIEIINVSNEYNDTALIVAVRNHHEKVVEALLEYEEIDVTVFGGLHYPKRTALDWALDWAIKTKDDKCLRLLEAYMEANEIVSSSEDDYYQRNILLKF